MPAHGFEVSEKGIKASYLRFLADSTPGYLAILVAWVLYRAGVFPAAAGSLFQNVDRETKIFVGILLFLIATPFGLALNAAGWFALGRWTQIRAMRWLQLWPLRWLVYSTNMSADRDSIMSFFFGVRPGQLEAHSKFDSQKFWEKFYLEACYYEELLRVCLPDAEHHLEHVKGLKRLMRSCFIVMTLAAGAVLWSVSHGVPPASPLAHMLFAGIVVSVICFVMTMMLEYYKLLNTLLVVYLHVHPDDFAPGTLEDCVPRRAIVAALRRRSETHRTSGNQ